MFLYRSSNISAMASIQAQLDSTNLPSLSRGMWSAWLSQGVCVFVFQCVKHKPLGLNIAGILFLFPFLSLSLILSVSLPFLAVVPPWRRQQWPYCERWELGSRPMMSSCHREDQGERPPGVRNALFFPVVFRKAVINLIPSSSLPVLGWGAKEAGRESQRRRRCRE